MEVAGAVPPCEGDPRGAEGGDLRTKRELHGVPKCKGATMTAGVYRIYAVQYAHRETNSSEVFYGDQRRAPMAMDYFVWAVTDGERTVVVDLGFTEAVGARRGRTFLRDPSQ